MKMYGEIISGENTGKKLLHSSQGMLIEGTDFIINYNTISYYTILDSKIDNGEGKRNVFKKGWDLTCGTLFEKSWYFIKIEYPNQTTSILKINGKFFKEIKLFLDIQ